MPTQYCLKIGGSEDAIAVVGPFDTEEEAQAEVVHYPIAVVDVLINPQTLKHAREGLGKEEG
jgi:hypothetical protein